MNQGLIGKKLLILGGVQALCDLVANARKMGIITYVTDYLVASPAKKFAHQSFMVSCTDVEAVVALCRRECVDAVFTGYLDSILPFAQQVCEKLDLPFCGNRDNIEMCVDKRKFKLACISANVPVIPGKSVSLKDYADDIPNRPVVIKPVDYSGSKGVYKCYSPAEYVDLCKLAFSYSKKKKLLIESMMDVNSEFSVYYLLYNGEAYMVGMGDRYVSSPNPNTAPRGLGMRFPSLKTDLWLEKMDSKIRRFFSLNEMKNGFVFLQGFCEEEEFFINEIGYRLNGGFTYKIAEKYTGVNVVHLLLQYSLTGKMDETALSHVTPRYDGVGYVLTVTVKNGKIGKVCGLEEINTCAGVYEFCQLKFPSEIVSGEVGTTAQVFAYVIIAAKSRDEVVSTINFVKQNLKVLDANGESMMNQVIDASIIK